LPINLQARRFGVGFVTLEDFGVVQRFFWTVALIGGMFLPL
jgi:hypothetical protein